MPSQDSIGSALLVKKAVPFLQQINVLSDKCVVMNEDITNLKKTKADKKEVEKLRSEYAKKADKDTVEELDDRLKDMEETFGDQLSDIDKRLTSTSLKEESDEFKFIENLRENFLVQMVDNYTRYRQGQDPSILDLIITNNDTLVEDLQYDPPIGKSDHLMLTFKIKSYLQDSSSKRKYT